MIFILLTIAYLSTLIANIFFLRTLVKNNYFDDIIDLLFSTFVSAIPFVNIYILIFCLQLHFKTYSKEKTFKIAKKIFFIKDKDESKRERYRKTDYKKME